MREKDQKINELNHQLDWFKRQLFGTKSEKHRLEDNPYQTTIADLLTDLPAPPKQHEEKKTVTYQRGTAKKNALDNAQNDSGLRFDDTVPVEEIRVAAPELEGAGSDRYEIIDEKVTCRLAQKPSSYVILKYIQPVIKEKTTQKITTAAAPANVLEKSIADVSLLAGLLVDKFLYHLPLHRQHQRIEASGIKIARSSLTNWVQRAVELLKPIYQSQLDHILLSRILAIDETPIKAGREKKGKLKQGYFWPFYGDNDEICFTFSGSRAQQHLWKQLDGYQGTILSDGYSAYERYAQASEQVTHAQCWVHTRRYFEQAQKAEPQSSGTALAFIGKLYDVERTIKDQGLNEKQTIDYRQTYAKPVVDAFFAWVFEQRQRVDLVNSDPLSKALMYAHNREHALRVYLSDGNLQPDTNHLERALRVIPMGRKNWLFAWTEIGAEHIGIIQSLLATCRLHDVNPYDYLVDVLQRIDRHPANKVEQLTPRLWKEHFTDNPLRSDVFTGGNNGLE
ncbi:MAG: IS66 family transposase [Phycisphaerae bacterium]|nr:IS66 family transposase [candidate division KSB1 bacterium]NIV03017.1 IS66 family transposase [Phycisphaerae bacterium]NIR73129.1 IS66 family transposase [candidate division KSB1 bacterium]NIS28326.1 IS66 family transposase [candidate division KSB1 bacterium]NIT75214.1 IS66 family transposase [candidate division KSB1 bacterium]